MDQSGVEGAPGELFAKVTPKAVLVIRTVAAQVEEIVAAPHRGPQQKQVQHKLVLRPGNQATVRQRRQDRTELR